MQTTLVTNYMQYTGFTARLGEWPWISNIRSSSMIQDVLTLYIILSPLSEQSEHDQH
jgi:hypothetical protein